jgi:LysM repeat protein
MTTTFSFSTRRTARALTGAALLLAAPALPAQNSPPPGAANPLASMSQDITILNQEVNQLRLEVENLRQSNDDLKNQIVTQRDVQTAVQNGVAAGRVDTRADITQANAALRKEIVDQVSQQIAALTADTNKQLETLAKAIQATPGPNSVPVPRTFSSEFPQTGVKYTVKSGDNLTKIASQNNSTVDYIKNANKITDDRSLKVGQVIFLPQKTPSAPPPGAVPVISPPPAMAPVN